jgi:hypothetical protein
VASGNKPERVIKLGVVSAAVFANVREADGEHEERTLRSVQLQRRYRDNDGTWKNSTSFDLSNLPVAIEALRLAFAYLVEQETAAAGDSTSAA